MLWIERAAHALATALQHMCIEHSSPDVLVSQEFLHRANVIAVFQKVDREAMTLIQSSG
jgi:hypothetical protein